VPTARDTLTLPCDVIATETDFVGEQLQVNCLLHSLCIS